MDVESRFLEGPVGRLDSRWHGPRDGAPVVVLHPHPRFGGTMGTRLVYDLCQALASDGWRAVRFDFRGVGRSDGGYGWGDGEAGDAIAVLEAVEREAGAQAVLVGYSFGAAVAVRAAASRPVARLILAGVPAEVTQSRLRPVDDAPRVRADTHLVVGDRDPYVSPEQAWELARAFPKPAAVTVLGGCGHFLEPAEAQRAVAVLRGLLRP